MLDGSTPWEIDEAMEMFGCAAGPFEMQDVTGLDVIHDPMRRREILQDRTGKCGAIAKRMLELGKLGRKTGAGWYRYPGGGGKVDDPIVADLAIEEAYFAKITRREFTTRDIQDRMLAAMVNAACGILSNGGAVSADDIDLITVAKFGFPRWRGGLMTYADTIGADVVLDRINRLAAHDPDAWKISPLLKQCGSHRVTFTKFSGAQS
ncbi:MAG: 3-hydroxyacyl-CoA dehydrogenase family protein [Sulfitobacter sp.]